MCFFFFGGVCVAVVCDEKFVGDVDQRQVTPSGGGGGGGGGLFGGRMKQTERRRRRRKKKKIAPNY
jgi:hypothetical protein